MSRYSRLLFATLIILVTLALTTGVAEGQSPVPLTATSTATPRPTPTPSPVPTPTPSPTPSIEERLALLEKDVDSKLTPELIALLGVVIGAILTYLTALSQHKMELARFYSRRWWEKKDGAYAAVIEALATLSNSLKKWIEEEVREKSSEDYTVAPEKRELIQAEYKQARGEIERIAHHGDYLLSARASAALAGLIRQLRKRQSNPYMWDSWFEKLGQDSNAVEECRKIIKEEAESELQKGKS